MMTKTNRLCRTKDIDKVFRTGQGVRHNFLALKFAPNKLNYNRFAFIVSKKVSKKATTRNRIKRLLREAVKANKDIIEQGQDLIFLAISDPEGKCLEEIKNIIKELLEKAKINVLQ